jgi:MFS family permease
MTNVKRNFLALVWHGFFLALAQTFAERNTVLPALILAVGGTQTTLGVLTSIVIGVPMLAQLIFAGFLNTKVYKKGYLILGIMLRVIAFAGLSVTIWFYTSFSTPVIIGLIFVWMLLFSTSGAFAGISYTDIVGKSMDSPTRKKFLVTRQFVSGIGLLLSALTARQILHSFEYPQNYQIMFAIAAGLLFVASWGFMSIKEKPSELKHKQNSTLKILKSIPQILKEDKKFRYFIYVVNLTGFSLTIIPFYIALGRESFSINAGQIGNLLLIQIVGMILANLFWSKYVHKKGYRGVLFVFIMFQILLPMLFLVVAHNFDFKEFAILFFFVGIAISAQKISFEGILYEITDETNRALYSGVYGALSLTLSLFPLVSGLLLNSLGFIIIFPIVSLIAVSSLAFVKVLKV